MNLILSLEKSIWVFFSVAPHIPKLAGDEGLIFYLAEHGSSPSPSEAPQMTHEQLKGSANRRERLRNPSAVADQR